MNTILVVDDSPTIRRMIRAALRDIPNGGFVEAGSGLEAVERLTLGAIGLMVLDLNMPDMHGLEVLKFVRQHPKYARLPVVVVTTRGDDASRAAALEAGATLFVTKPFAADDLARKVSSVLGAPERRTEGQRDVGP